MDNVPQFAGLHAQPGILVLPNAWDCASARIFEEVGFPAIGTTSAGIAFSLGYPDGEQAPWQEHLQVIRRIARCVSVPVSADIEAGYDDLAAVVMDVAAAGIAGVNLEDAVPGTQDLIPLGEQLERISTVKETGIFLNARTDAFWLGLADPGDRLRIAIERARAFVEAGADCVFIPGLSDPAMIAEVTRAVPAPINILGGPGVPSAPHLQKLGVRRVSMGSGPVRSSMGHTRRIADELRTHGTYEAILSGAITYPAANQLFRR